MQLSRQESRQLELKSFWILDTGASRLDRKLHQVYQFHTDVQCASYHSVFAPGFHPIDHTGITGYLSSLYLTWFDLQRSIKATHTLSY